MLAMGKSYWAPGHRDRALEAHLLVGQMGSYPKPGEGAERALKRKQPVLLGRWGAGEHCTGES